MAQFLGSGKDGRVYYNPVIPCKNPANTPRGNYVSKEYTVSAVAAAENLAMAQSIGNTNNKFSALPFAMCESATGSPLLFSAFAGKKTLKTLKLQEMPAWKLSALLRAYKTMYVAFMAWWEGRSGDASTQIIHGDLHEGNITYNDASNRFYIIDYDRTSQSLQKKYSNINAGHGTAEDKAAAKVEIKYYMPMRLLNIIEGILSKRADFRAGKYMDVPHPIDAKIVSLNAEKESIYAAIAAMKGSVEKMTAELRALESTFEAANAGEQSRIQARYNELYRQISVQEQAAVAEYARMYARMDAIEAEKKALNASYASYKPSEAELRAQLAYRLHGMDMYIHALERR